MIINLFYRSLEIDGSSRRYSPIVKDGSILKSKSGEEKFIGCLSIRLIKEKIDSVIKKVSGLYESALLRFTL